MDKKLLASTLKRLREMSGLTQNDVAAFVGKKQQTVASWESGQSQPDVLTLFRLCQHYGADINRDFGLSSMEISESITIAEKEYVKKYRALDEHGQDLVSTILEKEFIRCTSSAPSVSNNVRSFAGRFPHFGYASAGTGTMAHEEPLDWPYELDPPKGATCTITIKGDSMEPKYHDGETVWVDTTQMIEPGQIGVFVVNGEAYCKKFVRDDKGARLVSLNPAYEPVVLTEDDEVRLFGKVVG